MGITDKIDIGDEMTDEVLFGRYKAGDSKAFDTLISRYKNRLFSFIRKSVKSQEEAEDLFQEVFFKVVEKREQFKSECSFKAWLYTICRNTCIDLARKKNSRREKDHLSGQEGNLIEQLPILGDHPLEVLTQSQIDSFLNQALIQLPPEQREVFELKIRGDLGVEEIAAVMNCSPNTAKSRLRYATETLRGIFVKRHYLR